MRRLALPLWLFVAGCGPQLDPGPVQSGTEGASSGGAASTSTSSGSSSDATTTTTTTTVTTAGSSVGVTSVSGSSEGSSESSTGSGVLPLCLEVGAVRLPDGIDVADVDGDGRHEIWAALPGDQNQAEPNVIGYQVDGVTPTSVYEGFVTGTILGFADMNGDGLDDLHFRQARTTPGYRRGQADLSLDELSVPVMFNGTWSRAFLDADNDSDADMFRLENGPLRIELLLNTPPSFTLLSSVPAPVGIPGNSELVAVHRIADTSMSVVELVREPDRSILVVLDIDDEGTLEFVAISENLIPRSFRGAIDLDGDGTVEILALASIGTSRQLEILHFDGDGMLVNNPFIGGILGAALGDFEGSGTPQILYREGQLNGEGISAPMLLRLEDDTTFELGDVGGRGVGVPIRSAVFNGTGADDLVVETCGFTCGMAPGRLVPC